MRPSKFPDDHLTRLEGDNPIVFDCVQAGPAASLELDVWYATQHLPVGLTAPQLRRYAAPAHAAHIYIQELVDADLPAFERFELAAPVPKALTEHVRCLGMPLGGAQRRDSGPQPRDAAYGYPIFFNVPAARHAEFNQWYHDEHIPMLLMCPHWVMCRRFLLRNITGCAWTHMALHYLTDLRAFKSPERDAARSTPWRRELEREPWFAYSYRLGVRVAS